MRKDCSLLVPLFCTKRPPINPHLKKIKIKQKGGYRGGGGDFGFFEKGVRNFVFWCSVPPFCGDFFTESFQKGGCGVFF